MHRFKHSPFLHPILFAAFPVLFLFAGNLNMVSFHQLLTPLLLSVTATLIVFLVCLPVFRNVRKAALFTTVFIIIFFQYSAITDLVRRVFQTDLPSHRYLLLALLAVLFITGWRIFKIRKPLLKTTYVINVIAMLAILPSVFKIAYFAFVDHRVTREQAVIPTKKLPADAPDIYYFILDGYPRHDVLSTVYNYNNGPFLNELQKRGFYVAERSTSNYYWTKLSIPSSLNFDYLSEIPEYAAAKNKQDFPLRQLAAESAIRQELKSYDYQYISFASGFEITEIKNADQYWSHPLVFNEFNTALFGTTFLPNIFQRYFSGAFYGAHRQTIMYPFQHLPEVAKLPFPKFVQIHLLSPHPPFVFDSLGNPIRPARGFSLADGKAFLQAGTEKEYQEGLTNQIAFLNRQLLKAVDTIQKVSGRPAVILLQGDHGARLHTHGEKIEETELLETFANLSAFYFPKQNYADLYPEITPVNSFRVVLNQHFKTNLPLLPDRNFYCRLSDLANVTDVTAKVRSEKLKPMQKNLKTASSKPAKPE